MLNNAQELLSAERTPTLALALPVYETLISTLADLRPKFPELGHSVTCAINKLEYYASKAHHVPAYALSMAVNPCFKLEWIDVHWDRPARDQAYTIVREQMLDHFRQHPQVTALDVHSPARAAARALGSGFTRILTGGSAISRASNPLSNPDNNFRLVLISPIHLLHFLTRARVYNSRKIQQ
ncbi:Zinc finger, BED-type predicted [Ceratobasidium sp. AG-Ba]|nr:Zinc finger, BED-type predicted [Ceratobasidium sp. AG-Ba]QRW01063.1 Zinc finger, BED-type predicted [Ceratobasidium sp. AG-Ba]